MRDVPSWDDYFFSIAEVVATRSKDPRTQVGAVLVDAKTHRIVSVGYNGFPVGASETEELWQSPEKFKHVIHAEVNCLAHAPSSFNCRELTLYLPIWPCPICAQYIASHPDLDIAQIKVRSDYYHSERAAQILHDAQIEVIELIK
jgi:dCMP deaminase